MCQDCYGVDDDYDDSTWDERDDYDDQDEWPGDRDDLDDRYDEYKDNLAMGYINPDGSQREPDPPEDPWCYRPSLRQRVRWRIRDWRRRVRRGRVQQYSG